MYVKLVGVFFLPGNNQSLAFSIALPVILMSNHGKDAKKNKRFEHTSDVPNHKL